MERFWVRKLWNDKINMGLIFKKIGWFKDGDRDNFFVGIYYDEEGDFLVVKRLEVLKIREDLEEISKKIKEGGIK